jgi:hypothetical protein
VGRLGVRINVVVGDLQFEAALLVDAAPTTCQALLAALPIESRVIHAMWSGHLIIATPIDLGLTRVENEVTIPVPGDLLYHQRHQEIAIAYGEAQFQEPIGPVYVARFAHLEGDLEALARLGSRVQLEGAKPFRVLRA